MDTTDSLYSFYSAGGIKSGLTYSDCEFYLNGKPFQIFSGSLHYFRLLPKSWSESIKKMRHCHLNTVCTYIPWNLHEDTPDVYNYSYNLDLKTYINLVRSEDMFLILRVGPYICAEMDFGGLPSWLLKDKNMKLRTNYAPYLNAVEKYFTELVSLIGKHQFSVYGGPIIAIQIENEFGSFGNTQANIGDYEYMIYIKELLVNLGIKELLFTCDMPSISFLKGSIPDVLMTANFQIDAIKELEILQNIQPNKPLMVAELWSGWFDHWGDKHEEISVGTYVESLKVILSRNASFNIYVFQGGTNYEFLNGANVAFPMPESPYCSTITSYDYGALLTESGEYTEKYFATLELLKYCKKEYQRPECILDITPSYLSVGNLPVKNFFPLIKILPLVEKIQCDDPVVMEELGQRFGFTLYEAYINESGLLKFYVTQGIRMIVLVNFNVVSILENVRGLQSLHITHNSENKQSKLWILVENLGRVNFTEKSEILNDERRGIFGTVLLNNMALKKWSMYVLDFCKKIFSNIASIDWEETDQPESMLCIGFYSAIIDINIVKDFFIYSHTWSKGSMFINGFNIGRYWNIGPQQTLFVSKHLLKKGLNEITAFELHSIIREFELKDSPILNVTKLSA